MPEETINPGHPLHPFWDGSLRHKEYKEMSNTMAKMSKDARKKRIALLESENKKLTDSLEEATGKWSSYMKETAESMIEVINLKIQIDDLEEDKEYLLTLVRKK